jgi:hypothetical protein
MNKVKVISLILHYTKPKIRYGLQKYTLQTYGKSHDESED